MFGSNEKRGEKRFSYMRGLWGSNFTWPCILYYVLESYGENG